MNKTWSSARQRKYDYCSRAFYYHYLTNTPRQDFYNPAWALKSLKIHSLKQLFYDRSLSVSTLNKEIYREAFKQGISQNDIEALIADLQSFRDSQFFLETSTALVHHHQTREVESFQVNDIEVQGQVHFVWIESNSKVNIVNFSKEVTPFQILFGLKKLNIDTQKLNIGTLNNDHSVSWGNIDWYEIQEFQDKVLSFNYSEEVDKFPLTREIAKCSLCDFEDHCSQQSSLLSSTSDL